MKIDWVGIASEIPLSVGSFRQRVESWVSPIGVWTNGGETIHLHRRDPNYYQNLSDIPRASQTLSELLDERWTLDDLAEHNVLVKEQTTLKKIILDMENLVLANAGVDVKPRRTRGITGLTGIVDSMMPGTRPASHLHQMDSAGECKDGAKLATPCSMAAQPSR